MHVRCCTFAQTVGYSSHADGVRAGLAHVCSITSTEVTVGKPIPGERCPKGDVSRSIHPASHNWSTVEHTTACGATDPSVSCTFARATPTISSPSTSHADVMNAKTPVSSTWSQSKSYPPRIIRGCPRVSSLSTSPRWWGIYQVTRPNHSQDRYIGGAY